MSSPQSPPATTSEQIRAAWDRVAPGFDDYATPLTIGYGERFLRRADLRAGMRFLDVASGTGALAIPAARLGAEVLATDISPVMIDRLDARARSEGLTSLHTGIMDGTDLDLDDDTFDVAASQNGVSLFPDLQAGLAELVRVTRSGGRVLIVAFGPARRAEFLTFFLGALQAAVPGFTGPPMDPPPLPFQVADPEVLADELAAAGLAEVSVQSARWDLPFTSATHFWDLVTNSNPISGRLLATVADEQIEEARRVLEGMLRERSGGRPGAVLHAELNVAVGTV